QQLRGLAAWRASSARRQAAWGTRRGLVAGAWRWGEGETRRRGDKEKGRQGDSSAIVFAPCLLVSLSPGFLVARFPCLPVSLSPGLLVSRSPCLSAGGRLQQPVVGQRLFEAGHAGVFQGRHGQAQI